MRDPVLPRTSVANIAWPPIPSPTAASIFGVLFSWEQTQRWPLEQIVQKQFKQASELLKHAHEYVPYYSESLNGVEIDKLCLQSWQQLPLLKREHLQQNYEALKASQLPRGHGRVETRSTSGSTGKPVKVDWSQLSELLWHAAVNRDHTWHKRQLNGVLASIRHIKFSLPDQNADALQGMQLDNWGSVVADCFETGRAHVLSIHTSAAQQADWLEDIQADYLQTYPSNLEKLLDYYQSNSRTAPNFKAIRTISEVLDADTRQRCASVFNARVEDVYSTTEVGYLAIQCPEQEHLHVQSETHLLEVLDDQDRPCSAGQIGRIVVTPLHNFAMPLIRYDIGDYAEVGGPCSCGRSLPVLKRVLGRSRNLLTFPDGRTDWPVFNDTKFRQIAPVVQFQFTQTSHQRITLALVVERPLQSSETKQLRRLVLDRLGFEFDLTIRFVDTIARGATGKFEDFISLIR